MSEGSCVAVCAIWIAVAVCGWAFAPILIIVGPAAYFATEAIAKNDGSRP